jgi:hypothetical protein
MRRFLQLSSVEGETTLQQLLLTGALSKLNILEENIKIINILSAWLSKDLA